MDRDRNLLFGVFAVQLKKATPTQIMAAAGAWASDQSRDLPSYLEDLGAIAAEDRKLLSNLVEQAIEDHDGDVSATLLYFGGHPQARLAFQNSISINPAGEVELEQFDRLSPDTSSLGVVETPGRYSQVGETARGGMGRILLVHDEFLGRDIALKELLPGLVASSGGPKPQLSPAREGMSLLSRFLQEARITGQLEHPSIVPVYELGHRNDGTLYYTMKLVRGETLEDAIRRARDTQERLGLLNHFIDLCQGIAYAHSLNVIHRDIKPNNVMVGKFGETVVLDWGLAKVKDKEDVHSKEIKETIRMMELGDEAAVGETAYGAILGTPLYMSPEQARGQIDKVDERSDVYSLGAVLYEMLTGTPPFAVAPSKRILKQVTEDEPIPVQMLAPNVPAELAAICQKALSKDPNDRYPSAKALADEVQRFQSGALVQAHQYTFADLVRRFVKRNKPLVVTATMATLALVAVAAYYNVNLYQSRESERNQRIATEKANKELRWENYATSLNAAEKHIRDRTFSTALALLERCPEEHREWEWGRLRLACEPAFAYHDVNANVTGTIGSVKLSPSGAYLLIQRFFRWGAIQVHDILRDEDIFVAETGPQFAWGNCVQFLPQEDGFTASLDAHKIGIWMHSSTDPDVPVAEFDSGSGEITSVALSDRTNLLAAFVHHRGANPEIVVWERTSGTEVRRIRLTHSVDYTLGEYGPSRYWGEFYARLQGGVLGFSSDERKLVFFDSDIGVLDLETSDIEYLAPCLQHADYSPTSNRVAFISSTGSLEVWDLNTSSRVQQLWGDFHAVKDVALRADGAVAVVGGSPLQFWDVESGRLIHQVDHDVGNPSFSHSGKIMSAIEFDMYGKVQFWDTDNIAGMKVSPLTLTNGETAILLAEYNEVSPYAFHAGTERLVTFVADMGLRIWQGQAMQHVADWPMDPVPTSAAWSPDATQLAAVTDDAITIFEYPSRREIRSIPRWPGSLFQHCAFSPDGKRLLMGAGDVSRDSGDGEGLAWIVDIETGETLYQLDEHLGTCRYTGYSPDGRWIVTGSFGAEGRLDEVSVRIWDATGKPNVVGMINGLGWPWQVVFASDSSKLIAIGYSSELVLYDLATHEIRYRAKSGNARRAAFFPDNKRLAVVRSNGLAIHAVEDGRELVSFPFGSAPLWISEDGLSLTVSNDAASMLKVEALNWHNFQLKQHRAYRMDQVRERLGLK